MLKKFAIAFGVFIFVIYGLFLLAPLFLYLNFLYRKCFYEEGSAFR